MPPQALWLTIATSPPRRLSSTAARRPAAPLPTTTQPWRWTGSRIAADVDRLRRRPLRQQPGHDDVGQGVQDGLWDINCHGAGSILCRASASRFGWAKHQAASDRDTRANGQRCGCRLRSRGSWRSTWPGSGCRAELAGGRVAAGPDAGLEALDAGGAVLLEDMANVEARPAHVDEAAGDRDPVAVSAGRPELRACRHQRPAEDAELRGCHRQRPAGGLDEHRGRIVEEGEEARIEDDARRVAVAPLDPAGERCSSAWSFRAPRCSTRARSARRARGASPAAARHPRSRRAWPRPTPGRSGRRRSGPSSAAARSARIPRCRRSRRGGRQCRPARRPGRSPRAFRARRDRRSRSRPRSPGGRHEGRAPCRGRRPATAGRGTATVSRPASAITAR